MALKLKAKSLTEAFIQTKLSHPPESVEEVLDFGPNREKGLYLRLSPSETKTFIFQYRFDGKARRVVLDQWEEGIYGLEDAREAVRAARLELSRAKRAGTGDPLRRQYSSQKKGNTAGQLVPDVLEAYFRSTPFLDKRESTQSGYRRALTRHFKDKFPKRLVTSIRTEDISEVLDEIGPDNPVMQNRAYAIIRVFWSWASAMYPIGMNVDFNALRRDYVTSEEERERYLSDDELRRIWKACEDPDTWKSKDDGIECNKVFGKFIQFVICTGQRNTETRMMLPKHVSSISYSRNSDGKELKAKTWTIPSGTTKGAVINVVPLNELAQGILSDLPKTKEYQWFTRGDGDKPLGINFKKPIAAINKAAEIEEPWSLHDLRRTVRTNLPRCGCPDHVAELIIGHRKNKLARTYDRYAYLEEKAAAMDGWGQLLQRIVRSVK